MIRFRSTRALLGLFILLAARPSRALTADELLLVVNKNQPESQQLADFYATARGVPAGRIAALDLPTGDELAFDTYEHRVVAPLVDFLHDHHLEPKIKCLVIFYGVPLRIAGRRIQSEDRQEIELLTAALRQLTEKLAALAAEAESIAAEIDHNFTPLPPRLGDPADPTEVLVSRVNYAGEFVSLHLSSIADAGKRQATERRFMAVLREFAAPRTVAATAPAPAPASSPTTQSRQAQIEQIEGLQRRRFDPAARKRIRELAVKESGLYGYAKMLTAQIDYLSAPDSEAAVDDELPLLRWTFYKRSQWLPNPLHYRFGRTDTPPVLMVMRLDAPTPQQVRDMIAASLKAERDGLRGRVVLDARGIQPTKPDGKADPFGVVDESIRSLAALVRGHTELPVLFDDKPDLIAPGAANDVALYCGWYSPGKYVPGLKFVPGSVGYHIASYELTGLHSAVGGWCRGMINDGITATLGPVAEPFLHSFPNPNEFFPLLLTGKLTLAEVYWKTCPLVSWRMAAIGDPLYMPFKTHPALKAEDLPESLREVLPDASVGQ